MQEHTKMKSDLPYNVFLIGFMGSGKSTVSNYLSTHYQMEKVEMDQRIAHQEGMSISDIFQAHGEEYFRDLETKLLIELQKKKNIVVSCGGGVPMREKNVAEMKKNGKIVYLDANPKTIYERVKNSHDRPLLEHNKNIPFIAQMMEQRRPKYEAAADITVQTDKKSVPQICKELYEKLTAQENKECIQ